MSNGWGLSCRNCGYHKKVHLGCGFLFPKVYSDTLKAAREGKLGSKVQSFLENHPDGALNCDRVLLQCEQCGLLTEDLDLSMYIPSHPITPEPERKWSVAFPFEGSEYVTSRDLEQHYLLAASFEHLCPDCQKPMKIITSKDMQEKEKAGYRNGEMSSEISCPSCKAALVFTEFINWD